MESRTLIIFLSLLVFVLAFTACASSASSPVPSPAATTSPGGATLVQERCTACHPLSRVESARYSAAEWKTIVDTMIARGAQLTPEEETVVVSYLAANFGN